MVKVAVLEPDSPVSFLNGLIPPMVNNEQRAKGFRVPARYQATDEIGHRQKRDATAKAILGSVQELGKGNS